MIQRGSLPGWHRRPWRPGLVGKFSLATFLALLGLLSLFTGFLLHHEQTLLRQELMTKLRLLAHDASHAAELGLLTNNISLQREAAHFLTGDPDVVAVQMFDHDHHLTVVEYGPGREQTMTGLGIARDQLLEPDRVRAFPATTHPALLGLRRDVKIPADVLPDETLLLDRGLSANHTERDERIGSVQVWLSTARMAVVLREVSQRLAIAIAIA